MKPCTLISCVTGKQHTFKSLSDAADYLGYGRDYLSKIIRMNTLARHRHTKETFTVLYDVFPLPPEVLKESKNMIAQGVPFGKQPCGYCKKFCRGCEWSERFEPVPGWCAIPTLLDLGNGNKPIPSFKILYCPKFVKG